MENQQIQILAEDIFEKSGLNKILCEKFPRIKKLDEFKETLNSKLVLFNAGNVGSLKKAIKTTYACFVEEEILKDPRNYLIDKNFCKKNDCYVLSWGDDYKKIGLWGYKSAPLSMVLEFFQKK